MKVYEINQEERKLTCNERIILGNKLENLHTKLHFNFSKEFKGIKHIALLNPITNNYTIVPIVDDDYVVGLNVTTYPGKWTILIIISEEEIINNNLGEVTTTFISDPIKCLVKDNFLNNYENLIDPQIKMLYNEMIKIKNELDEKLETDYYKGKDGKSAYDIAVENGYSGTEEEWIKNYDTSTGVPAINFDNSELEPPEQEDFEVVEF